MDLKAELGQPVRAPAANRRLAVLRGQDHHPRPRPGPDDAVRPFLEIPGQTRRPGEEEGGRGGGQKDLTASAYFHWAGETSGMRTDRIVRLSISTQFLRRIEDPLMSALCTTGICWCPARVCRLPASSRPRSPQSSCTTRARIRHLLVEIQNVGKNLSSDAHAALRRLRRRRQFAAHDILGPGRGGGPAHRADQDLKGRTCAEQNQTSGGPLLALETTTYALSHGNRISIPRLDHTLPPGAKPAGDFPLRLPFVHQRYWPFNVLDNGGLVVTPVHMGCRPSRHHPGVFEASRQHI